MFSLYSSDSALSKIAIFVVSMFLIKNKQSDFCTVIKKHKLQMKNSNSVHIIFILRGQNIKALQSTSSQAV